MTNRVFSRCTVLGLPTLLFAVSCTPATANLRRTPDEPTVSEACKAAEGDWAPPEECLASVEDGQHLMMKPETHASTSSDAVAGGVRCEGIPDTVDLSAYDTPVKVQYGGRCSAYGLVAAIENRAKQLKLQMNGSDRINLSETHLFWAQRFKFDSASAIQTAEKSPIMDETFWREDNYKGWRKVLHRFWGHPDKEYMNTEGVRLEHFTQLHENDEKGGIKTVGQRELCAGLRALAEGKPLYMALSVNKSLYALDSPVDASGAQTGGHAVAVVGYDLKAGTLLIKNSWGETKAGARRTDGAKPGYQNLPFSYCGTEGKYCGLWVVDSVKIEKIERVFRP